MKLNSICWTAIFAVFILRPSLAEQNVWLDFNAGWNANLASVAVSAGVASFSDDEVNSLEGGILKAFNAAYDGFTVNFFSDDPGGQREHINFGAMTSEPSLLGQTTLDFRNRSQGTQSIFVGNFANFVESATPRTEQLDQLSKTLSGTAAHELGHAFGLRHFYSFGDTRITPANYSNTAGIQNEHLMATGSTGLNELQREMTRTYSAWSRLQLEAGNGLSNTTLNRLLELFLGDIGAEIATAEPLPLQTMNRVDADAGFAVASLSTEADVDLFAVDVTASSLLTAEIWSGGGLFDATLRLFDSLGDEVAFADNILYSATSIGSGTDHNSDSWLLNIPVEPGTYYVEVGSLSAIPVGFGGYELTLGLFAVPEPTFGIVFLLLPLAIGRTWNRN